MCALESVQARRRREEQEARDAAVVAAEYAQVEAQRESARAAALEEDTEKESDCPPLTKDEWQAEVLTGLAPAIQYMFEAIAMILWNSSVAQGSLIHPMPRLSTTKKLLI